MTIYKRTWFNFRYRQVLIIRHFDIESHTLHIIGRGWAIDRRAAKEWIGEQAYQSQVAIMGSRTLVCLDSDDYECVLPWNQVIYYDRTPEGVFVLLSRDGQPQSASRYRVEWVGEDQWKLKASSKMQSALDSSNKRSVCGTQSF